MEKTIKTPEEQDRANYLALSILAETDGGKLLIANSLKDIARIVDLLATRYREESHFELVRLCADLNSNLSLYKSLVNAEQNLKDVDVIIEALTTDE